MSHKYSHLIWLGAGSASEPQNVLSSAEKVILVDARESACKFLQKKSLSNVTITQALLCINSAVYEFHELNLPEFSAIQEPTGLTELFPGVKTIATEKIQSKSIAAFIQELNLRDNNNLLIADILDSNLALLQSLQAKDLLRHFNEIRIQTSNIPLYASSSTTDEVMEFLSLHGFIAYQSTHEDPDLPWVAYKVNPLWIPLQSALNAKLTAEQESTNAKQALVSENAGQLKVIEGLKLKLQQQEAERILEIENKNQEIERLTIELDNRSASLVSAEKMSNQLQLEIDAHSAQVKLLQIEMANKTQEENHSNKENKAAIEKLHSELDQLRKLAESRLDTISQLEQKNKILYNNNALLDRQQKAIDAELLKTEAQIDLLKTFFLSR